MRIVQVLGGAENGGLEKHTIELTKVLIQNGIDVSVIAHKKFRNDFKYANFIELDLSKSRNNPIVLFKLYKILKKENFDLIHTQANKATDLVMKLKPFLNVKIISTLHGYKKNIKSYEKADFVITVSKRIGEKLKNINKETIYNGIEIPNVLNIDLHKKFDIPKERFILCCVGRFVNVKRFDIILKSIQKLDVHLILIGDGEEYKKLIELSKALKLEHKTTFTGVLSPKKTQEIIKSIDLLVITSQREGFSYVFAESLILKTPLISTDVADIRKFIPSKYIIPFENIKKISDKIETVRKEYKIVTDDFIEKFNIAKNEFSMQNMAKKTLHIYEKALK